MRRARQLLIAVFALALALPGLALFDTGARTMLQFENRPAAPWPSPRTLLTDAREFTLAFERAFAERFGGRDALVRLHHLVNVELFGVSPVSAVMLGRHGWLYFLGEHGTEFDLHHLGRRKQCQDTDQAENEGSQGESDAAVFPARQAHGKDQGGDRRQARR